MKAGSQVGDRIRPLRVAGASTLVSLISITSAIGIWWILAVTVIHDDTLLPAPDSVAQGFLKLSTAQGGAHNLWPNVAVSLSRILVGWCLAVLSGLLVGVLMATNRYLRAFIDPLVELARPVPALAFVPLLVVWFGIGETPKILVLIFAGFPVIVIATVSAIFSVDETWKHAALALGASRFYLIRRVIIPGALPEIITGMRIAIGLCWSTVVAAEIIASANGLGWMILEASRFLDTDNVFVGIIMIALLAYSMDRVLRLAEIKLVPWKGRR